MESLTLSTSGCPYPKSASVHRKLKTSTEERKRRRQGAGIRTTSRPFCNTTAKPTVRTGGKVSIRTTFRNVRTSACQHASGRDRCGPGATRALPRTNAPLFPRQMRETFRDRRGIGVRGEGRRDDGNFPQLSPTCDGRPRPPSRPRIPSREKQKRKSSVQRDAEREKEEKRGGRVGFPSRKLGDSFQQNNYRISPRWRSS